MNIKSLISIAVIGIILIASITTYQFIKPYYDEYTKNEQLKQQQEQQEKQQQFLNALSEVDKQQQINKFFEEYNTN